MQFRRKLEDNLMVYNVSILYSYICDRNLADLDNTLKRFAYYSGVFGQISFLKGKFSYFLAHAFTMCAFDDERMKTLHVYCPVMRILSGYAPRFEV
jgi:hypothetical protein